MKEITNERTKERKTELISKQSNTHIKKYNTKYRKEERPDETNK